MRETLCLLRKLLSVHGGLKAVAKVDVQQLAAVSVQHEVAWMPVPQAQQVAHLHMERRGSSTRMRRHTWKPASGWKAHAMPAEHSMASADMRRAGGEAPWT